MGITLDKATAVCNNKVSTESWGTRLRPDVLAGALVSAQRLEEAGLKLEGGDVRSKATHLATETPALVKDTHEMMRCMKEELEAAGNREDAGLVLRAKDAFVGLLRERSP